jgi:hypothetical protein
MGHQGHSYSSEIVADRRGPPNGLGIEIAPSLRMGLARGAGAVRADAMPAGILISLWSGVSGLGALTRGFAPGYSRIAPSEAAEKK